MKLKDKVALITGGAGGIGKAVALAYAREGARLAICARTESEINETVQEIQKLKAEAKSWSCDVSIEDSVKDFFGDVIKEFGRIDVLVSSQPESVTDVFVYLGSDQANGITGKMLGSSGWKSQL